MVEIEERRISERVEGMTPEELKAVAEKLPDSFLWNEIQRRYTAYKMRLEIIENTLNA